MDSDQYSGHVEPGGPAISRRIDAGGAPLELKKFSVGPMDNNVYLLTELDSRKALLVDAANERDRILSEIEGVEIEAIVTTHGHYDHWQALDAALEATGASLYLHSADAGMVEQDPDRDAEHGMRIPFGDTEAEVIYTPGHTKGSICLLLAGKHLITGDTLFPGGPGNTFGSEEAFEQIMKSLRDRLFTLPDDTWVYPGHGDDTTLGIERPSLDDWQARGW